MIKTVVSFMLAFFSFLIINTPSVKLIYSSDVINIITVMSLWALGIYRLIIVDKGIIRIGKQKKRFIILFTLLWIILLSSGIFGPNSNINILYFIQYIGVYVTVLGILLFVKYNELSHIVMFQILWALILSLVKLTIGIDLDADKGQHYLTVGVPLASGLVTSIGLMFISKSIILKISLIFSSSVITLGLTSLYGRAPIILSAGTILFFWILLILHSHSIKIAIKRLLFFIILVCGLVALGLNHINDLWIYRFMRLADLSDEPRYYLYKEVIELNLSNPFGYGLNAHGTLIGNYPHNIFLEFLMSAGIISVFVFVSILTIFIKCLKKSIQIKSYLLPVAMLSTYLLLTWNVSFNLTSSYIPFGVIAALISSFEDIFPKRKGGE